MFTLSPCPTPCSYPPLTAVSAVTHKLTIALLNANMSVDNNKRLASSPAEKESDSTKRRYTWQDMKISSDSKEFTEANPEESVGLPALDKHPDVEPVMHQEPPLRQLVNRQNQVFPWIPKLIV